MLTALYLSFFSIRELHRIEIPSLEPSWNTLKCSFLFFSVTYQKRALENPFEAFNQTFADFPETIAFIGGQTVEYSVRFINELLADNRSEIITFIPDTPL